MPIIKDAKAERLAILLEEMGEALQVIGKIQRHGWESVNPDLMDGKTNLNLLTKELGQVCFVIGLMGAAGDIAKTELDDAAAAKARRVINYLHCPDNITLTRQLLAELDSSDHGD